MKNVLTIIGILFISFAAHADFSTVAFGKWNGPCHQDGDHYFHEAIMFSESGRGALREEYFKNDTCSGIPSSVQEGIKAERGIIVYDELGQQENGAYILKVTFINQKGRAPETVSIKILEGGKQLQGPFGTYRRAD